MFVEKELRNIFDKMNDIVFGGIMPKPEFTVCYGSKIKLYWSISLMGKKTFKISVNHLRLSDNIEVTYLNMLHQMIHMYNYLHGVVDTCKSERYHTKKFRNAAIKFGFIFNEAASKDFGYLPNALNGDLLLCFNKKIMNSNSSLIEALDKDEDNKVDKPHSSGKPITWICPGCGKTLYANTGCKVICGFCFTNFIPKSILKKDRLIKDRN